ncbi:MAG: ribosome biogenesis factor YjgA, partial [Pseudomonadota bacterium]
PEKLRDAVDLAQRITAHGGLARQRNFVAKLLRKVDGEPIRATIERRQLEQKLAAREFHRLEGWRDRLVNEGAPAIEAPLAAEPSLDAAHLCDLVATARAERAAGRAPSAARELFRWLRETLAARPPGAG